MDLNPEFPSISCHGHPSSRLPLTSVGTQPERVTKVNKQDETGMKILRHLNPRGLVAVKFLSGKRDPLASLFFPLAP